MSGWYTALDAKIDTLDWLRNHGETYLRGYARSVAETSGDDSVQILGAMLRNLDRDLSRATPMYVHPEILDIVDAASETFQPEPLRETDVITPWGFVSLPRPFRMVDRHGKDMAVSRISWHPIVGEYEDGTPGNGIGIVLWSTRDDWRHDSFGVDFEELRQEALKRGMPDPDIDPSYRVSITHVGPWWFDRDVPGDVARGVTGTGWWAWVQVLLRISMQQISTRSYETAPRWSRRRAERLRLDDRDILVIKLRRSRDSHRDHEGRDVHWTHQWIVSGHWRNQWYPSLGVNRQIWISDYVKGPEDKPLVIRAGRAFELVR